MATTDVLIVGAGPTGLVLAIWLTRLGIRVRIVDKAAQAGATSRALAVQARTLELYEQAGLAQGVMEAGRRTPALNLWVKGARKARAPLDGLGEGVSPYCFLLIFPQDEHETYLAAHLSGLGVKVERRTEVLGFEDQGDGVSARLKGPGGEGRCEAAYIVGCDGAHSVVRHAIGAAFPGGTYSHLFYVADVAAHGPAINGELNVDIDTSDFLAVFPLKAEGHVRLIGTVRDEKADEKTLTFEDVRGEALSSIKLTVDAVNWFSAYRVHHRVAATWRKGRAFICGDAAHIHSPAGGQGMNTGLGDAINLAWKLAWVLKGRAPDGLLDSYAEERIGFARKLVATTDRAFTAVTNPGALAKTIRTQIVPALAPLALAFKAVRQLMFRTVSQTGITYRGSRLSQGRAGEVQGGDRPPWVAAADNFRGLDQRSWRLQVYGTAKPELETWAKANGVALQAFAWSKALGQAGYARDAAYLLRPDGYVALADGAGSAAAVAGYFEARGIIPT